MRVLLPQRSGPLVVASISGSISARMSRHGGSAAEISLSNHHNRFHAVARPHGRGFTLVELLVTMAVAVILIMIAVPSFKSMILSNKLTTTANDVVGAINIARMEAIKRNASVQLCSNDAGQNTSDPLGAACVNQTAGTVVTLVNNQGNNQTVVVLAGTQGIVMPIQLSGTMAAVRFNAQGIGRFPNTATQLPGTVIDICTSSMSQNNHRVVALAAGGSIVTTTTPTTSASCP
jgi:type IV fimbrial biogenesis protein FimT